MMNLVNIIPEVMSHVSSIKQERAGDLADVENDIEENNLNIKWIKVEKTEDVKYNITADVSSNEVGCGGQNSGESPARLDVFHNQTGCDEHKVYSTSEVTEYVSNIKEEKTDIEDVVMDIDDKYIPEKIADSKDSEIAEDTCKDGNLSESHRPYQCGFCEYKAARKDTLLRHFKTKHDDSPEWYECRLCEYRTKTKKNLRSHSMLQHNASAELYRCIICEFRTKYKHSLRDHFTAKHDVAAEWQECHLCEFKTKIKASLAKHFQEKHAPRSQTNSECSTTRKKNTHNLEVEWLQCEHCRFKTKSKNTLVCHYISKHPSTEQWYQCRFCEYGTNDKSDFKKHFKHKHDRDAEQHECFISVSLNKK